MDFRFTKDKRDHLMIGFSVAVIGSILFAPITGLLLAILAGVLKEVWDFSGRGTVEYADFIYTVIGGVTALVTLLCLTLIFG